MLLPQVPPRALGALAEKTGAELGPPAALASILPQNGAIPEAEESGKAAQRVQ